MANRQIFLLYLYRCFINLWSCIPLAMGIGRSKKEAKHAAAKNVLDKLIGNADPNMINSMNNSINDQML